MANLTALYRELLDRDVDPSGAATFANQPDDYVRQAIAGSPEYRARQARPADPYLSSLDRARSQIERQINAAIQEVSGYEASAQQTLGGLPQQYEGIYDQAQGALNQYASNLRTAQEASGLTPFAPAGAGSQPILMALAGQRASDLANVPLYQQAASAYYGDRRSALESNRLAALADIDRLEGDALEQRRREQADREWQMVMLQAQAALTGAGGGRGGGGGGGGGSTNSQLLKALMGGELDEVARGALMATGSPDLAVEYLIGQGVDPILAAGAIQGAVAPDLEGLAGLSGDLAADISRLRALRGLPADKRGDDYDATVADLNAIFTGNLNQLATQYPDYYDVVRKSPDIRYFSPQEINAQRKAQAQRLYETSGASKAVKNITRALGSGSKRSKPKPKGRV